jgi:FMN phosphatase YigB (HAD superfamily)
MNNRLTSPVRGIIFDLDGTLYDMSWYMKPLFFLRLFPHGARLPRFLHTRESFAGKDMGTRQCLLESLSEEYSKVEGIAPERVREWIDGPFYAAFVSITPLFRFFRPGIVPLLSLLRQKGLRLGVLSDYDHVEDRLARLSLPASLFDTIASSEASGALKPNSRPYEAMAYEWAVAACNILVIGDRADTDGAAAKAAGMQFLLIENGRSRRGGGLHWSELKKLLSGLDKR